MSKNDGGPAFPMYSEVGNLHSEGMSLRDYFAAAALQGMLCNGFRPDEVWANSNSSYSKAAYVLADRMLREREK